MIDVKERNALIAHKRDNFVVQAKEKRTEVLHALRTSLASCYEVQPYERGGHFGIEVTRAKCPWFKFTLSFRVENASRYFTAMPNFRLEVVGTRYDRNGRSYAPLYRTDRTGRLNVARMGLDVERAFMALNDYYERSKESNERMESSRAEFLKACAMTGAEATYDGADIATAKAGRYTVDFYAGDIHDGKIRVRVKLDKAHLTAEETADLINRLRNA